MTRWRIAIVASGLPLVWLAAVAARAEPVIRFAAEPGKVQMTLDGKPFPTRHRT